MAFKFSLQLQVLFLLLACIAPHVILARDLGTHKSYRRLFPQYLEGSRKGHNIQGIHDVKLYLQRYGYMSANSVQPNDNAFDDALESGLKKYQQFFKLNVSGILERETLVLMSQPRCGCSDMFDAENHEVNKANTSSHYTFFPRNRKWPANRHYLTYGFIHNFPTNFMTPVVRAFEDWDFNTLFSFTQAPHVQAANIVLSFERGYHGDRFPFDGRWGVLAHAFGPNDGRVHFDADENWVVGMVADGFDVQMVALHELGHVLGLKHSADSQAIMWPYMEPNTVKGLSGDDIEGIRALYQS
ncbi:metalloendoproteinase 1-like [Momordica charantia]|uniref:Metalloendoproteinase 1-like n=1 Tax=Momordica charantia TaxID=3673 RepID=A0A6J1BX62_MOMCH|nr:metalloendoproteinase 1-like [Momordica charantia]